MKAIKVWLLAVLVILGGCSIDAPNPYANTAALLNAPPPQTREELSQQCKNIYQEILFQHTKVATASLEMPRVTLLNDQQEAMRNVDALQKKYAALGCDALKKGTSQPITTEEYGKHIDTCVAKCKQYTERTPEQCFDSCIKTITK